MKDGQQRDLKGIGLVFRTELRQLGRRGPGVKVGPRLSLVRPWKKPCGDRDVAKHGGWSVPAGVFQPLSAVVYGASVGSFLGNAAGSVTPWTGCTSRFDSGAGAARKRSASA